MADDRGAISGRFHQPLGNRLHWATIIALAAATVAVTMPTPAQAAIDLFINGSGNGLWEDGNNWTSGLPPVAAESAFIDSGFSVTSSGTSNVAAELQVGVGANSYGNNGNPGGTGVLTLLSGSILTANGNLVVGQGQTSADTSGTINIEAGSTLNIKGGNSLLGFFSSSDTDPTTGTINVNGGAFNWNAGNNNATLWIGGESITPHFGKGVVNLNSGTMTGAAVRVGDFGTGTLNISGGTLTSNFYMSVGLGSHPGSGNGNVVITGGTLNLAQLTVNEAKTATCTVTQSGGTVNIGNVTGIDGYNARIGLSGTGKGVYNISGGVLNVAGNDLAVGRGLNGEMNISGAAVVNVNNIAVAGKSSDYGFALGGSNNGSAVVNQTGGTVTIFNTSLLGVFFQGTNGGTSTYNLSGGSLTTGGISSDNGTTNKTFNFDGGTLIAGKDMTVPNPARSAAPTNFFTTISGGGATIDTSGHAVTWVTPLTGSGSLTKNGAGSLTLTGANTYGGTTTIGGGELYVNNTSGSGTGANSVLVTAGTLGGSGTVGGAAAVGGTLSPGASSGTVGALSFGSSLTLAGASTSLFELSSDASFDHVNVSSALSYGGTLQVTLQDGYLPAGGSTFDLFDAGSVNGAFSSIVVSNSAYSASFDGSTGVLTLSTTVVPEPTGFGMALLGGSGLLAKRRRRAV